MELTPENTPLINALSDLYRKAHEELYHLEHFEPPDSDRSNEAQLVRLAMADRQRILRALSVAMVGRVGKVGQHLLPLGMPPLTLN